MNPPKDFHRTTSHHVGIAAMVLAVWCTGVGPVAGADEVAAARRQEPLKWIEVSTQGTHFVQAGSEKPWVAWGFNYDHDATGRLIEDYWHEEWPRVEEDFREMRELGANTVRIHLQLGRFMSSADEPDRRNLDRLRDLVRLAETTGLYLNLTGLGCYHQQDVPPWYDALSESERWSVQERFWEAVAGVAVASPAVFCFDLMNEPILPGSGEKAPHWLAGEFGGKHFVQRITLDLAGRSREDVAKAWLDRLVSAIRRQDRRHLITVGVIPWAHVFPGAQPLFHGRETGRSLDFVSVHFYPKGGKTDRALKALESYEVGKPLVVEEMFPLECSVEELDAFIEGGRGRVDGWLGFYWGKTIEEYAGQKPGDLAGALTRAWLEYFRRKTLDGIPVGN